jgi:citrate lyase beta subunit
MAEPGDTVDPGELARQMMADLQRSNPQLAMLAQMMQARTIVPEPVSPDLSDEVVELAERLAEAEAKMEAMKRQARRLFEAHRGASERLADLAAALGACGLCWGEDDLCPSCRGRGRPGMVRPDLELRTRLFGAPRRPGPAEKSTTH